MMKSNLIKFECIESVGFTGKTSRWNSVDRWFKSGDVVNCEINDDGSVITIKQRGKTNVSIPSILFYRYFTHKDKGE